MLPHSLIPIGQRLQACSLWAEPSLQMCFLWPTDYIRTLQISGQHLRLDISSKYPYFWLHLKDQKTEQH